MPLPHLQVWRRAELVAQIRAGRNDDFNANSMDQVSETRRFSPGQMRDHTTRFESLRTQPDPLDKGREIAIGQQLGRIDPPLAGVSFSFLLHSCILRFEQAFLNDAINSAADPNGSSYDWPSTYHEEMNGKHPFWHDEHKRGEKSRRVQGGDGVR